MSLAAINRRLRRRTWALGVLLLCLSLLNTVLPSSPTVANAATAAPLDLAAMAPTAVDLEADGLDGYTFWPAGSAGRVCGSPEVPSTNPPSSSVPPSGTVTVV